VSADTLKSFEAIADGQPDDLPEPAILYVGGIERRAGQGGGDGEK
jgi:hypothetical protein